MDSRVPIVGQIQIFSYWCVVEEVLCEDNIKVGDFSFSFFGKQEVFVSCFVYVYFSSVEFTQVVSKICPRVSTVPFLQFLELWLRNLSKKNSAGPRPI